MIIKRVTGDKKAYMDLLLLADEQESMIDRYLERGEMFVLDDDGIKAECVVTKEDNGVYELKNIAVAPEHQHKGLGKRLIDGIFTVYPDCRTLFAGTGDVPSALAFYHSCGFTESHRIKNFFTDNYDHPMFEDGIQLTDMVYLKRERTNAESVRILKIREHGEFAFAAVAWFSSKWSVPLAAYEQSINECLSCLKSVPQWYIAVVDGRIIAGMGVIENDFHNRKDLTPNVCAVFVEPEYRCKGLAGRMLDFVCNDMASFGITTLYLVTDHTSFYERYGWSFYCMVGDESSQGLTRLYKHEQTV